MPNPSYESQMLNASPAGSADQVIRPPVSPLLRLPTELQIEIGRHLPLASHLIYHFQVCRALRMLMTRPGLIFTGGHGYWSLTEWLVAASELQQIFAHRVGPVKEAGDQLPLPSQSPLGGKEYKVAVTTTSEGDRHSDLATLALDFLGLTQLSSRQTITILTAHHSYTHAVREHVYWAAQRRCESDERPEAWKSFELTEEIEQELLQELDGPLHVILHGSEDEQGALDLEKALLYSKIRCVHCHRPIIWE
ncbi:hypothetical protein CBOM_02344 [Ceraceosorus bombacis]|uniref:F-box domain-containing protein n=1 Tax=Ceraceosorus bombacis TaxID=401625 RepID=A0A0P1BF24_9BASI|nr:hypothetical protein CBOM_02344 [Ceraceosorus bombacis]